ncbi:TPA: 30S ribosomal protein S6e [Candidatus Woesearchaeota archaeon]|nr:30S ribosomal protein S6e [Candidatus Woesearchaeota archaeon]
MEMKINIGDPKAKRTLTHTLPADDAKSLFGRKIGDKIKGEILGKAGYEFEITGGSDNAGFPMRKDATGTGRRKILVTRSIGQQQTKKGVRIRKTVAGNTVSDFTSQINVKVTKHGAQPLFEEKKEEAAEEPKAE